MKRNVIVLALVAACATLGATAASAAIPDPGMSTCVITVTQFPVTAACAPPGAVPTVRLCPAGAAGVPIFDTVKFDMTVLDAGGFVCAGVPLKAYEAGGTVNISASTVAVTNAVGFGSILVTGGSGCGAIQVCAGGVPMCRVNVISPDVATGALPPGCPLLAAPVSFINVNDFTNPVCGYFSKFGPVTPANACWNLNCDAVVNASDVLGMLGKGGVIQHFGHGGLLGPLNTCP